MLWLPQSWSPIERPYLSHSLLAGCERRNQHSGSSYVYSARVTFWIGFRRTGGKRAVLSQGRDSGRPLPPRDKPPDLPSTEHNPLRIASVFTKIGEEPAMTIPCVLSAPGSTSTLQCSALLDTGSQITAFIDQAYVSRLGLYTIPLPKPRASEAYDGIARGVITHLCEFDMAIGYHYERITAYITPRLSTPIILGSPWFTRHRVRPDTYHRSITFEPEHCSKSCLPLAKSFTMYCETHFSQPSDEAIALASIGELCDILQDDRTEEVFIFWPTRKEGESCEDEEPHALGAPSIRCAAINPADLEQFMKERSLTDPRWKVPVYLHEYLDMFDRPTADKLPPHRPEDHEIKLIPGQTPPFKKGYQLSQEELKAAKKYIDEHLAKGFIRPSTSHVTSPIILVKKPGGGLRLCVDYRAVNAVTIKNRYPIPRIREMLDRLCKAKFYTKFDIVAAFNTIRVKEGSEYLTSFTTRYGQFEYLVMPFGLCNAPSTFQSYINGALQDILDEYCTAYLDDILVFSNTLKEHKRHVREVLKRMRKAGLYADIDKSEFHVQRVKYLGMIITTEGLQMDPDKVQTVLEWPTPRNVKDILAFLGFANFYRRFIQGFGRTALPLTDLTKTKPLVAGGKPPPFLWSAACHKAFDELKRMFSSAPILCHYDADAPTTVEVDTSDFMVAGVLSQTDGTSVLRPVAYFSKKMSPQECNYEIYDKELLAIVKAFEEWRPELATTDPGRKIKVLSDHRSLEYFMSTKELNRRQARWSEFLSEFQFQIQYRPGKQGTKPDSLTRRPGDQPVEGDERIAHQRQTILKGTNLADGMAPLHHGVSTIPPEGLRRAVRIAAAAQDELPSLEALIAAAYEKDGITKSIITAIREGDRVLPPQAARALSAYRISLAECRTEHGKLFYFDRTWVPDDEELRLHLIREHHDSISAGHPGREKTFELLQRYYYWPGMNTDTKQYVRNYRACYRTKAFRSAYEGGLTQLKVPCGAWKDIAVDFVVDLPLSQSAEGVSYNNIMVVTDRLTKLRHYVPCTLIDAVSTAKMFYRHVWSKHGIPDSITSDRGTQFIAVLWKRLCERLGISRNLSSAFHPQTDGQSENSNQGMEQYLRAYVNYLQDDWVEWLPAAEFAANNHISETTGATPFFATYGFHPRFGVEPEPAPVPMVSRHRMMVKDADEFAQQMEYLHTFLREQMTFAQSTYEATAARRRKSSPAYKVGDMVWLDARNIQTQRPAKKLDSRNLGPFKIEQIINPRAYKLALPTSMRIHPVFHTSLLHLDPSNPLPGQTVMYKDEAEPEVVAREDTAEEEWEVSAVLDSRRDGKKRRLRYLV